MSEIKVFRVTGKIDKPNWQTDFKKEVRALKAEEAVERIYKEMGSRHRAKRFHIKILKVEMIGPEEITDPVVRKLTVGERESVQ